MAKKPAARPVAKGAQRRPSRGRTDALSTYRAKRQFERTPEPRGRKARREGWLYTIQKHAARRLHYDLRLELDGVLKSWAVTRGPSVDPADRRLAVRTEDHPVDYATFEGRIPEGSYGAGTVLLWDRGTWEPIDDPHVGLARGKLAFRLHGERLTGRWALVRFKGGDRDRRESWLLIKEKDDAVDRDADVTAEHTTSVGSGRDIGEIAAAPEASWSDDGAKPRSGKPARAVARATPGPVEETAGMAKDSGAGITIDGVRITHPDKVLYPQQGVTKRDLAAYLQAAADRMLPHVARRLVSMVRCPEGRARKCFFQRHAGQGLPGPFKSLAVRERSGRQKAYVYIENTEGLLSTAQIGVLELHIWGSRIDRVEVPDRIVFDLDPDPSVGFGAVKRAAERLRDALDALDLRSYPLLTGGKGVHVVVPIARRYEWPVVKDFAGALARRLAEDEPDRYVATMSRAKRKGRVFIDHFRNDHAATAIAPYSVRAREGAPVAWPVGWSELVDCPSADNVTIASAVDRLRKTDPWKGYNARQQSLKADVLRALGVERPA